MHFFKASLSEDSSRVPVNDFYNSITAHQTPITFNILFLLS